MYVPFVLLSYTAVADYFIRADGLLDLVGFITAVATGLAFYQRSLTRPSTFVRIVGGMLYLTCLAQALVWFTLALGAFVFGYF